MDPIDQTPTPARLFILGLQHVLVMYAGNLAVPLLAAGALHLPPHQTASLITADLFAAGLATLIQTLGFWKFGARLPVMMGATFLSVGPVIAMGADPAIGLNGFYGAVMLSGLLGILIAPLIGHILPLFPAVVTGSLITLMGISLLSVAIRWTAGGGTPKDPSFAAPSSLLLALFVFLVTIVISRYGRGMWRNLAVILGIAAGTLVSIPLGLVHVRGMEEAAWIAIVLPFQLGVPTFHFSATLAMSVVMVVTLVESAGVFLALAELTGTPYGPAKLVRALRADGLGILLGGVFSAFPYTSYAQNVGLVSLTGVRSRFVCAMGGAILIALGLLPKLAHLVSAVPEPVLGGAGVVMFGMVAATGIRILSTIDFAQRPYDLLIVASALGIGMIPTLSPQFFQHLPAWISPVTGSSVVLGTLIAVVLNLFLNGMPSAPRTLLESSPRRDGLESEPVTPSSDCSKTQRSAPPPA